MRLLTALLTAVALAGAPSCALLNQAAESAETAADTLRDAALALELLDALAIGYADHGLPTPDELSSLASIVENLGTAHDALQAARSELKSGHVFDGAEQLRKALSAMDKAANELETLGVDVGKAREALQSAERLLEHLR